MVPRFAAAVFVSATLLFACQPMVARMILPLLGGAPAVWIVCSLCFQALVLGGYTYAHVASSRLPIKAQAILQIALCAVAFLALPIAVDEKAALVLTKDHPSLGIVVAIVRAVGAPVFVLCTTAPLLQRWVGGLGEKDPYWLYAASNGGSMIALLGYPFLLEPLLSISAQTRVFRGAYVVFAILVAVCAITAFRGARAPATAVSEVEEKEDVAKPITSRDRLVWIALGFAPSSLLLGATTYVTTDIASVPLLWVVPLALYLGSFVVAFAKKQPLAPTVYSRALALATAVVIMTIFAQLLRPAWIIVTAHLLLLFIGSIVCNRALALRRPPVAKLTEYYLLMSVGGVLGGAFNGLLAPLVFRDVVEYPIAIVLVCAARYLLEPTANDSRKLVGRDVGFAVVIGGALFAFVKLGIQETGAIFTMVAGVLVFATYAASQKRPLRYALALGALFAAASTYGGAGGETIEKRRDFFGVLRITTDPSKRFRMLVYGQTLHGRENLDPVTRHIPGAYYFPNGPAGDVLGPPPARSQWPLPAPGLLPADTEMQSSRRVGVVGLGTGTLVAYVRPGEQWTFFELNPIVPDIARTYFSFLGDPAPGANVAIEIGDGRLLLRDGPAARFDVLVIDAFSSDAIPLHLLTREALVLYRRSLREGGVILAHVSNRHVRLQPVLAALARDANMLTVDRIDNDVSKAEDDVGKLPSEWVLLADEWTPLAKIIAKNPEWKRRDAPADQAVWTDDFVNILSVLRL